jgi:xanthine dehydrogenase YagT iron-sulfur-binding subunit
MSEQKSKDTRKYNAESPDFSRRSFLATAGTVGVVAAFDARDLKAETQPTDQAGTDDQPATVSLILRINEKEYQLRIDPRTTLLDCLRETLALTGTKKGCDHGQCGACTVHVNGMRVNSCLSLALTHDGDEITTIEGLGTPGQLHPMQTTFIAHDAYQCGYCTSGQIMAGVACIAEGHAGSPQEIRGWMSGNLCRCGAYDNIVAAIQDAAAIVGSAADVQGG